MTEGGILGRSLFYVSIFLCVKRHADEEKEAHGNHSELTISINIGGLDEEEGEGEDDAAEDEQNRLVHVGDKQIRPNHAQCEGDDEANERVVLPVHQRFFNSLMRSSGFSAPNT